VTALQGLLHGDSHPGSQQLSTIVSWPFLAIAIVRQFDLNAVRVLHVYRHAVAVIGCSMEDDIAIHGFPNGGDIFARVGMQVRVVQKAGMFLRRRPFPFADCAVQRDVMVIPAERHKDEPFAPHGSSEPEDITVEGLALGDIGHLQVHMADASARLDCFAQASSSFSNRIGRQGP